jgi:hypothetical protein
MAISTRSNGISPPKSRLKNGPYSFIKLSQKAPPKIPYLTAASSIYFRSVIMERITHKDIHVQRHIIGGFTLSYIARNYRYFKQRYRGCTLREAKKDFIKNIQQEVTNVQP